MKKYTLKILSLLLIAVLCTGLLPAGTAVSAAEESKEIKSIYLVVAPPIAGTPPQFPRPIRGRDQRGYEISYKWRDSSGQEAMWYRPIKCGDEYQLEITLYSHPGYRFAEKVHATFPAVFGKLLYEETFASRPEDGVCVMKLPPMKACREAEQVELTFDLPRPGEHPDFSPSVSEGYEIPKDAVEWDLLPGELAGKVLKPEDFFVAGRIYDFSSLVTPVSEEEAITRNTKILMNGRDSGCPYYITGRSFFFSQSYTVEENRTICWLYRPNMDLPAPMAGQKPEPYASDTAPFTVETEWSPALRDGAFEKGPYFSYHTLTAKQHGEDSTDLTDYAFADEVIPTVNHDRTDQITPDKLTHTKVDFRYQWPVSAKEPIPGAELNFHGPVAGETPSFLCELPDEAAYQLATTLRWYEGEKLESAKDCDPNKPFEKHHYYWAVAILSPKNGYTLKNNPPVIMEGRPADLTFSHPKADTDQYQAAIRFYLADNEVSGVSLKADALSVGTQPTDIRVHTPEGAPYNVPGGFVMAWFRGESPENAEPMTGTFVCGETYCGSILVQITDSLTNRFALRDLKCTVEGAQLISCTPSKDGTYLEALVKFPALAHTLKKTEAVPATCTEPGREAYWTCTVCGKIFADEKGTEEIKDFSSWGKIAPLGHSWDDPVYEWGRDNKTCTAKRVCKRDASHAETAKAKVCEKDGVVTAAFDVPWAKTQTKKKQDASDKFKDVPRNAWYHDAVNFVFHKDLFGGMSIDTFEPETPMSRAMLVTVLWRFEGKPKEGKNIFTDVPADQWFTEPVMWAAKNEIVNGVGNGKFDPDGNITREQMAAILYRYAEGKGYTVSSQAELTAFPDAGQVGSWAEKAVKWTVAEEIIGGSDGKLLPQGNATRAQVAAILMRFYMFTQT